MNFSDITNEQLKNRLEALLGEDKGLQAEAAYYTANNTKGYDLTLFYIPQEKRDEITELLKKGKKVGIVNVNNGYVQAFLTRLNYSIAMCIAQTLSVQMLLELKEQNKNSLCIDIIKSKLGLYDVAKLFNIDKNGIITFSPKIEGYAKAIEAEYYMTAAKINAIIAVFEGVVKWTYFGHFVVKDIPQHLKNMKKALKDFYECTKRYISILEKCSNDIKTHQERWSIDAAALIPPDKIKPSEETMKEWNDFLEKGSSVI